MLWHYCCCRNKENGDVSVPFRSSNWKLAPVPCTKKWRRNRTEHQLKSPKAVKSSSAASSGDEINNCEYLALDFQMKHVLNVPGIKVETIKFNDDNNRLLTRCLVATIGKGSFTQVHACHTIAIAKLAMYIDMALCKTGDYLRSNSYTLLNNVKGNL